MPRVFAIFKMAVSLKKYSRNLVFCHVTLVLATLFSQKIMVTAMFDLVKSVGKAKIKCVVTKYATIREVFLQHVPGSF